MLRHLLLSTALVVTVVTAQCVTNTNPNCYIGALPQDTYTVYYDPNDNGDIELFAQGLGTCDAGSSALVIFQDSAYNAIATCGCLPLDGSTYVLDCPGVNKGTIAHGAYQFEVDLGPNYALDRFTITHTQQTATAATPTTYVTSTTYEGTVSTSTSTITSIQSLDPATVTTPISTGTTTITVTPATVVSSTTLTKTYTRYGNRLSVTQTVRTVIAPCKTVKPSPCPTIKKQAKVGARDIVPGANGYTVTGDGPLTTTVTPSGVVSTQTVNGGTTTNTETAYTTTTTTVPPTPATVTIFTGPDTAISYVTLATPTSYITKRTATRTTIMKTFTITWARTQYTTPVCARKP
jgi:hypothetical protein